MARRGNALHKTGMIGIEFDGFAEYAEKIDMLGGDLIKVFSDAMQQTAETIQADTRAAVQKPNLPAAGKYSTGDTANSIISDTTPQVSGSVISVDVGFDKSKPGSGGFLITGTPRMQPAAQLAVIYDSKGYMKRREEEIKKLLQNEISKLMG